MTFCCRELLGHLSSEQFEKLERALCSAEGLGTLNRSKKEAKQKSHAANKKTTEPLSNEDSNNTSTSTPLPGPTVPSVSSPECVFEPRPPQSSREGMHQQVLHYSMYSFCGHCNALAVFLINRTKYCHGPRCKHN